MLSSVFVRALNCVDIPKAASNLIKAKPTYIALGDVQSLPYADELGL